MSKPTIRDILPPDNRPPKRRSTDQVQTRVDRGTKKPPFLSKRLVKEEPEELSSEFGDLGNYGGRRKKMTYVYYGGGIVLGILVVSFLFSIFFGGAEVTVHPKEDTLTIAGDFRAVGTEPKEGELQYEIMTIESLMTSAVPATGSEEVEEKASGQIIIYNDFNSSPQRLIVNTRFETQSGLIYRIDKSVVVPGQTVDGDDVVPGSIEVTVFADEPGEEYNIGLTDFTIPGFKGADQFEHFYARSKTDMTGGFIGERLTVEESILEEKRAALRRDLETELRGRVADQRPEGFMSFENSTFVVFSSETPIDKGEEVEIVEKGVLHNVLFESDALAKYLAINTLASFDGSSDVSFKDGAALNLIPIEPEDGSNIEPWRTGEFEFSMSGNADIVWQFNEDQLKEDLTGRNKEAIKTILSGYPSIDEAEVVIRPFWKGSFPDEKDDIKIDIVVRE